MRSIIIAHPVRTVNPQKGANFKGNFTVFRRFSGERGTGSAQTLPQNAQVEVLGLVDNTWLHVRYDGKTGYIRRDQTSFTE